MAKNADKSTMNPTLLNSSALIKRVSLELDPEVKFLDNSLMYFDDFKESINKDETVELTKEQRAEFNSSEVVKNLLASFLDSVCPFIESKLSVNQI